MIRVLRKRLMVQGVFLFILVVSVASLQAGPINEIDVSRSTGSDISEMIYEQYLDWKDSQNDDESSSSSQKPDTTVPSESAEEDSDSGGDDTWQTVGIVAGVVAVVAVVSYVTYRCVKSHKAAKEAKVQALQSLDLGPFVISRFSERPVEGEQIGDLANVSVAYRLEF